MKYLRVYIFLISTVLFYGCFKNTCLEDAGNIIIVTKNITPIESIFLDNNVNLILTQGAENKVSIECGENLQPYISTMVDGNKLTIKNDVKCNWIRNPEEKINVYVTFTDLNYLHYSGYGDIKTTNGINTSNFTLEVGDGAGMVDLNIDANHTTINNYGSADITLKGKSAFCKAYIGFRGTFNFKEFEIQNFDIEFGSVFNGYINVTSSLTGTIKHTGNLYYKGSPSVINVTAMNSGKLIQF